MKVKKEHKAHYLYPLQEQQDNAFQQGRLKSSRTLSSKQVKKQPDMPTKAKNTSAPARKPTNSNKINS